MTIKEIAQLAGVSTSTVSKIINNKDDNINTETRNRVLKIVKDYHYTPYASAILSSTSKTFLLGILLKDSTQAQFMTQGILESAQENGYRIILCSNANSLEEEHKNIIALKNNRVDGIIWEPISKESLLHQHYFQSADIPVQFINTDLNEHSCNIDFVKLGYEAAKVLINYNHRQIACLTQPDSLRSSLVLEGFRRCLFDNCITFQSEMILPYEPVSFMASLYANQFTGVVSSHFSSALSFCEEYSKIQYHIPADLSLISLRDDARENMDYPPISCIKIPYYEFGRFLGKKMAALCEKNHWKESSFDTSCTLENNLSIDIPFTSKTSKIIVIGSINIDITLNVEDLPQPGQTVSTSYSTITAGGKGINQSIGVAKLKHPVSLIGRVGNDYEASIIYEALKENHVELSGIKRDINAETGKAFIHVQRDGESTISILSGANGQLSPNDIKSHQRLFRNTSFCLLQTEIPTETVAAAAETAKSLGIQTILKPATLKTIDASLMKMIDYFVPNQKEAALLCPNAVNPEEMANYFLSMGAKTVIITLGEEGCFAKNAQTSFYTDAIPFTPIDTTGAADAFISALAVYLSLDVSLEKSVRIATYAASFCINRQGVVPALIDKNSLELFIKKKEPDLLH